MFPRAPFNVGLVACSSTIDCNSHTYERISRGCCRTPCGRHWSPCVCPLVQRSTMGLLLLFCFPDLMWVPFIGRSHVQTCWQGIPGNVPSMIPVPATGESVDREEWCWVANKKSSIFSFLKNQWARAMLNPDRDQQSSSDEGARGMLMCGREWRGVGLTLWEAEKAAKVGVWVSGSLELGLNMWPGSANKMCPMLQIRGWENRDEGGVENLWQRQQWLQYPISGEQWYIPSLQGVQWAVLAGRWCAGPGPGTTWKQCSH